MAVAVTICNLYAFYNVSESGRLAVELESGLKSLVATRESLSEARRRGEDAAFPSQRYERLVKAHHGTMELERDTLQASAHMAASLREAFVGEATEAAHVRALISQLEARANEVERRLGDSSASVKEAKKKERKSLAAWLPEIPQNPRLTPKSGDQVGVVVDLEEETANLLLRLAAEEPMTDERKDELHEWAMTFVRLRLEQLQDPGEGRCGTRQVVTVEKKSCGWACNFHHVNHCFKKAIVTGSMLVHSSRTWLRVDPSACPSATHSWDCLFAPLSPSCPSPPPAGALDVIHCPISEIAAYGLQYYVPPQLARVAALFHRDPPVWFAGQTEGFLQRPAEPMQLDYASAAALADANRPLVAIHVRRTDKIGSEAAHHAFAQYMAKAETLLIRDYGAIPSVYALYLMSDDVSVIREAEDYFTSRPQFPRPHLLYSKESIATGLPSHRNKLDSLKFLQKDIWTAAHADYLVGTFSSQISRLVYELMQTIRRDPFDDVQSLDDGWYYG